jgi:hypothetical protein
MLRTLLCLVAALFLVTGASPAEKKKKGARPVLGKFVSFTKGADAGTLKITLFQRKKKGAEDVKPMDKEFKVENGTPVVTVKDGNPEKGSSPEALENVEKGTQVRVFLEDGKVTRVGIGALMKKKKNQ